MTEPQWSQAARIDTFVDPTTGEPAGRGLSAKARLFWDDEALYVGVSVSDASVRGGFPSDAVDPHLWERDTIEIMLDPDGDGDNRDYYEIQIGPQNLVFDSQFDGYNSPRGSQDGPFGHEEWKADLVSAVRIAGTIDDDADQDQGYTVEAKLPWKSFTKAKHTPPRPGDVWRANFYAMENNGGVAWSPILGQGNFHRASRFGRLRFTGEVK
ncbi:MAG: carbohydrate-binding family 9-like protein [Polyangiaceae bacterium]|nr:carbohydrate-binding family 9-like protein [Polyangiaceae bacterium]